MTATRSAAAVAAPRSRPSRDDVRGTRPDLRVVPPRRPTGAVVVVALLVVFGVLLATAALNTVLVSGQRDLDRIEAEIREGEQRNQALRLRVAELESPERIVAAATAAGMIQPDEVRWIALQPDGTSDVDADPRTTDGATTDATTTGDTTTDERADAGTGTTTDADGGHR